MFQQAAKVSLPDGPSWQWLKAQGVQESGLNPRAKSPVGAEGLMQFMPGTWREVCRDKGWGNVTRSSAYHSIVGGAHYQARMARIWYRNRTVMEAYDLGLASYNAGAGNIIKAQSECNGARYWSEIAPCLSQVTGPKNARETTGYVRNIHRWRGMMPAEP